MFLPQLYALDKYPSEVIFCSHTAKTLGFAHVETYEGYFLPFNCKHIESLFYYFFSRWILTCVHRLPKILRGALLRIGCRRAVTFLIYEVRNHLCSQQHLCNAVEDPGITFTCLFLHSFFDHLSYYYNLGEGFIDAENQADAMIGLSIESDSEAPSNDASQSANPKTISLEEYRSTRRKTPAPASMVSHTDVSLEEKYFARDECEAVLAASKGGVILSDEALKAEDALAVLEKTYTAGEKKVEALCNQAAKLNINRGSQRLARAEEDAWTRLSRQGSRC